MTTNEFFECFQSSYYYFIIFNLDWKNNRHIYAPIFKTNFKNDYELYSSKLDYYPSISYTFNIKRSQIEF